MGEHSQIFGAEVWRFHSYGSPLRRISHEVVGNVAYREQDYGVSEVAHLRIASARERHRAHLRRREQPSAGDGCRGRRSFQWIHRDELPGFIAFEAHGDVVGNVAHDPVPSGWTTRPDYENKT